MVVATTGKREREKELERLSCGREERNSTISRGRTGFVAEERLRFANRSQHHVW